MSKRTPLRQISLSTNTRVPVRVPANALRLYWSPSRNATGGSNVTTFDLWLRFAVDGLSKGVPFTTPAGNVTHLLAEDYAPGTWGASGGGLWGIPLPLIESGDQCELVMRADAAAFVTYWFDLDCGCGCGCGSQRGNPGERVKSGAGKGVGGR